jgi:hypothetical protein
MFSGCARGIWLLEFSDELSETSSFVFLVMRGKCKSLCDDELTLLLIELLYALFTSLCAVGGLMLTGVYSFLRGLYSSLWWAPLCCFWWYEFGSSPLLEIWSPFGGLGVNLVCWGWDCLLVVLCVRDKGGVFLVAPSFRYCGDVITGRIISIYSLRFTLILLPSPAEYLGRVLAFGGLAGRW